MIHCINTYVYVTLQTISFIHEAATAVYVSNWEIVAAM